MRPTMPRPLPLSAAPLRRARTSGTRLPPIWLLPWLLALACLLAARPAHAADTLAAPRSEEQRLNSSHIAVSRMPSSA